MKQKMHLLPEHFARKIIFQVPVKQYGIKVITPSFVSDMHKREAVVMVWTINNEEEMEYLYSIGVDTIMTDDPRLLMATARKLGIRK